MNESPNREDPFREQLEAYALGALDPGEADQVREHLGSCHECRGGLADLERFAVLLPNALAALGPPPPAELKARLLATVAEAALRESRNQRFPHHDSVSAADQAPTVSAEPPVSRPVRRPWVNITALTRLAAAAVVILALGWSVRLAVALEHERAIKAEFAALVSQQEVVLEVVDSDKTVRRVLLTTNPASCEPSTCSYGKLFTRSDLRHVVAMAARLPSPPAGQAYRLWLTESGLAEPAGTMTLDDKGFGLLVFDANQSGPTYDRAELVLQPMQSRIPDGDVVLLWTPSAA